MRSWGTTLFTGHAEKNVNSKRRRAEAKVGAAGPTDLQRVTGLALLTTAGPAGKVGQLRKFTTHSIRVILRLLGATRIGP
jgi:hypothetical protein